MRKSDKVLADLAEAPVTLNVHPGRSPETICGFIEAMKEEGYRILEILARPLDEAIELLKAAMDSPQRDHVWIGMGTVKTERDAKQVVELNPDFIVSPTFSARVLHVAAQAGIPYIPGVITLQDVQDILEAFEDEGLELKVLKVCPVNILNHDYFGILSEIYPGIVFCPTGTGGMETLSEWKKIPSVGPVMESLFVPPEMLDAQDWSVVRARLAEITAIAKQSTGR